ncbi:3-mercaptopyruvate sulfurtransferase [Rhodobiaceae bacterium]|nr:3-mercaptopyruvate sulfurtransferase [Rhodobiaceae bacterium]
MGFAHPEYLISADELAGKLGNDNLRLFDVSFYLKPNPKGGMIPTSGQAVYDKEHIPGAAFLNQYAQLTDKNSPVGFTRLPDDELIQAFADAGISEDSDVVFYSTSMTMWSTRAWWLLNYCGHKKAAILDGGLKAWKAAGLELSTEPASYAAAEWSSSALREHFADKEDVVAAIDNVGICTVNALSPEVYAGTGDHHYGRRGHIPNSINVFYDTLLENEKFRAPAEIKQSLSEAGLLDDRPVIAYCGGGISATIDAFACLMSGKTNVAVYDGSMGEWVRDASLPLVEGSKP